MTQMIEVRPTFDVQWQDVEYQPGRLARVHVPQGMLRSFTHAAHGYARAGRPNRDRTVDALSCCVDRQLKAAANGW